MDHSKLMLAFILFAGLTLVDTSASVSDSNRRPVVHIAYFVPSDREPLPGYVERLDRVMKEVQRFFREGMAAAGYTNKTFRLDQDKEGNLRVHLVHGRQPTRQYGRNAGRQVRNEVKAKLAAEGISIDRETLVIFEVLLQWQGKKAIEIGPYLGSGNHLMGTAWVYDDQRLDPKLLSSKEPGGYYVRPCSIGEFNSHYIGGVAHELGHAFGLPHTCQRKADRRRGRALMGTGNHTYGQELRNEGPGTFLSETSAMMLPYIRPFSGDLRNVQQRTQCEITNLEADFLNETLVLEGHIDSTPAAYGIAAYNDSAKRRRDYDAVGWACRINEHGGFRLKIGELQAGSYQLRLNVCHVNGAKSRFSFDYQVDEQGRADTDVFKYSFILDKAVKAYHMSDKKSLDAAIATLENLFSDIHIVQQKVTCLRHLSQPRKLRTAANIPAVEKKVAVSQLRFSQESVGWRKPLHDEVPTEGTGDCFLQVGGKLFTSGLYAHAPSSYRLELKRKWQFLRFGSGLQDGHDGSVVFVIRSDGKEVYRSQTIDDHRPHEAKIDVSGVNILELVVEDSGDGNNNDWGLWLAPTLER